MGVGAAIAAGNHLEKGIWALFVIAAVITSREVIKDRGVVYTEGSQFPWWNSIAMESRIRASPTRLVRAVIIPAASDLLFW